MHFQEQFLNSTQSFPMATSRYKCTEHFSQLAIPGMQCICHFTLGECLSKALSLFSRRQWTLPSATSNRVTLIYV